MKLLEKIFSRLNYLRKKQYDKSTHLVTIQVGNIVLINEQPKFKLDRSYHGPYRVYEVTDTTVKVVLFQYQLVITVLVPVLEP